jgi:hypothetical protein
VSWARGVVLAWAKTGEAERTNDAIAIVVIDRREQWLCVIAIS